MTIGDLLKKGADILGGYENSSLNCEVLLAYVLGVGKEYLFAHSEEKVDGELVKLFYNYLRRVKEGEPVAYITGEKEFYGLKFYVDKRVLVPRPETEQLVDKVLDFLNDNVNKCRKFRILDVGTGSGNIAVSVVKKFNDSDCYIKDVDAIDKNYQALEVAEINVGQHGFDDRIHVYQSDLLEYLEKNEKYDVIVANLPYIGREKNRYISADTEKHEPNDALFGGKNGLELYKKMFQQVIEKNVNYDVIIGEFGFAQCKDMELILNKYFAHNWSIEKDLAGIDRIFTITR
ncbi:peptide chain release factor N(5)-glutamine methyltransferase [Candidatus Peregrinibacteria bacterium]|nr:peptide chain release factor N(5)-glutamine methyltransferase [Candidatus Peregrinibacteria bacterium]